MITFGSPHQGVFGVPECEAEVSFGIEIFIFALQLMYLYFWVLNAKHIQHDLLDFFFSQAVHFWKVGNAILCELVRRLISLGAYEPWIQVLNQVCKQKYTFGNSVKTVHNC